MTEPVPTTKLNLAFALGDHFVAGKIFLNYRRGAIPASHRRSTGAWRVEFTAADLFMDVEGHIKPGDDFVDVLRDQVTR